MLILVSFFSEMEKNIKIAENWLPLLVFFGKFCQFILYVDYEIWQRRQEGGLFLFRGYIDRLSSVLNKLNLLDLKKVRSSIRGQFVERRGSRVNAVKLRRRGLKKPACSISMALLSRSISAKPFHHDASYSHKSI